MFAQISDVVIFGRAVHDDVNSIRAPRDHQIVQYAPIAIKKQRIAHASVFQADDISGKQGFERLVGILAREKKLPHMTDIEQTRMLAGPEMLGHYAFILNRHHIARKAHHARAAFTVRSEEHTSE